MKPIPVIDAGKRPIDRRTAIKWVVTAAASGGMLASVAPAARSIPPAAESVTGGYGPDPDILRTYKPGDPAKVLTVTMDVPADSAAGKITDVATATAVLGNCKGNASANATSLTGLAKLDAAAITGNASLVVPGTTVLAGQVVAAPGPTPIGGVQTGAGGTSSQGSGRLLPIGMALGSIALVASLVAQRRRQLS